MIITPLYRKEIVAVPNFGRFYFFLQAHFSKNTFYLTIGSCQLYWVCETKWFRGEKGEGCVCCKLCNFYPDCQIESVLNKVRLKKKLEATKI